MDWAQAPPVRIAANKNTRAVRRWSIDILRTGELVVLS
jgi:hypothetical protein